MVYRSRTYHSPHGITTRRSGSRQDSESVPPSSQHERSDSSEAPYRPFFSPKFDVIEDSSSYRLYGEIPGVEKSQVTLEFVSPRNLLIYGNCSRTATHDVVSEPAEKPPQPAVQRSRRGSVIVEEAVDEADVPFIEKHIKEEAALKKQREKEEEEKVKWWALERNIGDFRASFEFPEEIVPDKTTAKLEHGILKVRVPKQVPMEGRKIGIQ
ncbi:hypothetical protein RUND412_003800 [Rhizina undulata]